MSHLSQIHKASNGTNGKGGNRHGSCGKSVILYVPPGTVIREISAVRSEQNLEWVQMPGKTKPPKLKKGQISFVFEATRHGKELLYYRASSRISGVAEYSLEECDTTPQILCYGGVGGLGNVHFLSENNRSPKFATKGLKGEQKLIELELKTICEIGLVGLPNAGKSTLLNCLTASKSKVGEYEFTTIYPKIGTIKTTMPDDHSSFQYRLADIPGIIKRASDGKGLGYDFLRHVERAKMLCLVIDINPKAKIPADQAFQLLWDELNKYEKNLINKVALVIANKADTAAEQDLLLLKAIVERTTKGVAVLPVSAKKQEGLEGLVRGMTQLLQQRLLV